MSQLRRGPERTCFGLQISRTYWPASRSQADLQCSQRSFNGSNVCAVYETVFGRYIGLGCAGPVMITDIGQADASIYIIST